jgi:hypothetical protein
MSLFLTIKLHEFFANGIRERWEQDLNFILILKILIKIWVSQIK